MRNDRKVIQALLDKVKTKSSSMRARGIAFAVEAISNLNHNDKEIFERIECVILAKIDDFIPHYIVKVMAAYFKMGFGSSDLY
ncbi:MAG: hypothetical protein ACK55Z_12000, partial [bacterium]